MLKDTCGALGSLRMMDRVPLQVAVISLSRGGGVGWGQWGRIVFVGCEGVGVSELGFCNIDVLLSVCLSFCFLIIN